MNVHNLVANRFLMFEEVTFRHVDEVSKRIVTSTNRRPIRDREILSATVKKLGELLHSRVFFDEVDSTSKTVECGSKRNRISMVRFSNDDGREHRNEIVIKGGRLLRELGHLSIRESGLHFDEV